MTAPKGHATARDKTERRRSDLQRQARALGDPTRFAIFQTVAASPAPVRVAELTREFGLNHNAVRQHLAKLCDAELLVEEAATRSGPGRPALQYRLASGVPGTWATHGPYESLSLLLIEMMQDPKPAVEVGREAGRSAAHAAGAGDGSPVAGLVAEMARRGFEPRTIEKPAGDVDIVLDFCPFATAAGAAPSIVCEIHRGLAAGFLEVADGDLELADLQVGDPFVGGCRLEVRPTSA